jgi:hypothetical protein
MSPALAFIVAGMDAVIAWCAFAGSWLLFAGPVYQASLELQEEGLERDRFEQMAATVPKPEPISAWWWLLPPVRFVLGRRRSTQHRRQMLAAISPDDVADLVRYLNKAFGWLLVGLGGLLLAINETWEIRERYEWPVAVFAIVCVLVAAGCLVYPATADARARKMVNHET